MYVKSFLPDYEEIKEILTRARKNISVRVFIYIRRKRDREFKGYLLCSLVANKMTSMKIHHSSNGIQSLRQSSRVTYLSNDIMPAYKSPPTILKNQPLCLGKRFFKA